ncbi:SDR family NAD(P)-dependent oxidoreductase [Streptomyces iranensis]|uniref:2O-beta-hydroxysteroid dehydrogenase n=1 Tax=Streptomyces iranensis TaxID=576784 RepID=A0A061A6Z3_9ACTN|nr:SDR family NAD(P)-dependent oxidoreductase [Streptomyces iranensis]MBP2060116.1 3-oxoacyl-[acyl-carrier protein] reductase [Streptomyces iranensis]CDR13923.1 2O-beta-hydroxysteroid dehydrogenase [Streptomyces iranensis]
MTDELTGLRCLIIGAASGIGRTTAQYLRDRRATVMRADRPSDTWRDDATDKLVMDVTDERSVAAAVGRGVARMRGLDAVVNTAGVLGAVQPSAEESAEDFQRLLTVNLTGAFIVSRTVLPYLVRSDHGRLVHFSSTAGKEGVAGMTGYSASKAGVMGLVKALAREYAHTSVTVNAIAPGKIDTPLLGGTPVGPQDLARIPMGRLGTAEEAAALVAYMISPAASYTTGAVFDLSGGRATW